MQVVTAQKDRSTGKWIVELDGRRIKSMSKQYLAARAVEVGYAVSFGDTVTAANAVETPTFNINERFDFVSKLVTMVANGVQASAVITGEGGLGKTYTVTKTLDDCGYVDISDLNAMGEGSVIRRSRTYISVKGHSTAKGMYRTLYENNDGIIVFDDCDSVLKDPIALNVLKSALDSYGKRIISWNADLKDDDLPRSFNFTGRVIFISNLSQNQIDQAIRSRSMMIDLSMTTEQKIERMQTLVSHPDFMSEFDAVEKLDALGLIREVGDAAKEISLRTLISVTKIRSANSASDWESLARYILVS